MGKKPYSGTADSGAAVARPNTKTTGSLGIQLVDSLLDTHTHTYTQFALHN